MNKEIIGRRGVMTVEASLIMGISLIIVGMVIIFSMKLEQSTSSALEEQGMVLKEGAEAVQDGELFYSATAEEGEDIRIFYNIPSLMRAKRIISEIKD